MAAKGKNKTAQNQRKCPKSFGEDKKQEKTKEQKIKSEKNRLTKIYQDIEQKRRLTVKGLIERAAYMRITLEELEEDINENGITEEFQQGNQDPYDRKRPAADFYMQVNNSYQKIIKQLTDLLPKEEGQERSADAGKEGDNFNEFVINRG